MVGLPYGQTNDKSLLGGKKMKRNNKLLTSIICLIIAFACIVCLASCGGGDEGGTGDGNCSHTYGEWTTTEEASCENDGEMQCSCTKCGETKTKTAPATGHSYVVEIANDKTMKSPATETDAAVYYKSCKCGKVSTSDSETFEYGGSLNHTHSFTEEKPIDRALIMPATCTTKATYYKSCVCGVASTSNKNVFEYGAPLGHKDEDNNHVCDACPLTVSEHNYVGGKCAVCGKVEKECDHTELYKHYVDLGELGACGGSILYYSCECGELTNLDTEYSRLSCDMDFSDEGVDFEGEDGNLYNKSHDVCSVCGLTFDVLRTEIEDGCTTTNKEWYTITMGEITIAKNGYYESENTHHGDRVLTPIDLSELGACGGTLLVYKCVDCNEITYVSEMRATCKVNFDEEPKVEKITDENGIVHNVQKVECPDCRLAMILDTWVHEISTCESLIYTVTSIKCADTVIVEITDTEPDFRHELEYTYKLLGTSCNDGYEMVIHCTVCGMTYEMVTDGHNSKEFMLDLSEFGGCTGAISGRRCVICDDVTSIYNMYQYCVYNGETTETVTDSDGIVHTITKKVCTECGFTQVSDEWSVRISDCVVRNYEKATIYKESECKNVIIDVIDYDDDANHNYEYTYEIGEGKTCEDGYRVYENCTVCGESDWWNSNYHRNEYVEVDFAQFGICSCTFSYYKCELCGHCDDYYQGYSECYLNSTITEEVPDENGIIHYVSSNTCNNCGAMFVDDSWSVPLTSCDFISYKRYTVYKDGVAVFEYNENYEYEEHNYEYTYYLNGDDCNSDYYVSMVCTKCGKTDGYNATGHKTESVSIFFSKFGMCGGSAYEEHCTICKKVTYVNADDWCNWELVKTENGLKTYTCSACGGTKTILLTKGEKDEYCQQENTIYTVYIVDGKEVYSYTSYDWSYEHKYVTEAVLQGETCEDGVMITIHCPDCNDYNEETVYYHQTFSVYELPSDLGCCDNHLFNVEECLCGDTKIVSFDRKIYAPIEGGELTCPNCSLVIKIENSNTQEGSTVTKTITYIVIYDGEEVYRTEESYEYEIAE